MMVADLARNRVRSLSKRAPRARMFRDRSCALASASTCNCRSAACTDDAPYADEAGGDEVEGIVGDCLDLRAYWNDEIWYDACDQTNIETFRSANFTLIWDGGDRAKYEDDFCEGRLRR